MARVSFREGGPQRRVVVHCALEFLLLQKAGTISDTVFAKYTTQAPIRTARCLPCFRQEPTVGMLRQFRLDDVVAHFISISESGPIKSVTVSELKHTQVGGDGFALGKTTGRRAQSVDDAPDDDNGDESELDWARAVTTHSASAPAPPCPSGTPALADAVARDRTRFSKFKTCWRMSKMSSPRRPNGESSPAGDTGVDPLEVWTEEAREEPCGANESGTPVAVPAIPAYHANAHDVGRSTF